jgi:N-acetylmuramic acid 6-phosphate etherase
MVDVQASNAKLVERQENMLLHLTGADSKSAREALRQAQGSVKLAVLLLRGCDPQEGREILERAGGQLRTALTLLGQERPAPDARLTRRRQRVLDAG